MSDRTVLASNDEQKIAIMLHLYSFCEQIQDHLTTITDMHPKLNEKGVPFRGQGNIRPIQCNVAVNTLEEVITRLQSFCHIFRTDVYSLPLAFIILRYRLLSLADAGTSAT